MIKAFTAVLSQNAVSAHLRNKEILFFRIVQLTQTIDNYKKATDKNYNIA